MYSVSNQYKIDINKGIRNLSYMRVFFGILDLSASGDTTPISNDEIVFSNVENIVDGTEITTHYATMEHNLFRMDGSVTLPPADGTYERQCYISNQLCDDNGYFAGNNPIISMTFSEPHSVIGLTLTFDAFNKEHPELLRILAYDGNESLILDETLTIDNYEYTFSTPIDDFYKIELEFLKMRIPNRRARLQEVMFGLVKTYTSDDIISSVQSSDVDIVASKLPLETFKVEVNNIDKSYNVDNPTGIYKYIEEQQPVAVEYGYELSNGEIEWIIGGSYVTTGEVTTSKSTATIPCSSVLNYLTQTYYKGMYYPNGISMYQLATDVLVDADLTLLSTQYGWKLDESLHNIYTKAPLPKVSHRECLQLIANASGCVLYTDRDGHIRIQKASKDVNDFKIDFTSFSDIPTSRKRPPLFAIDIKIRDFNIKETVEELHKTTVTMYGNNRRMLFEYNNAVDVSAVVTNGTLVSAEYYAGACYLTINGNGQVNVVISGKKLEEKTRVVTYLKNIDGEIAEIDNPLVTSDDVANNLNVVMTDYLTKRSIYDSSYRGNVELDVGDIIYTDSNFSKDLESRILKHEISFDGTMKGKITYLVE